MITAVLMLVSVFAVMETEAAIVSGAVYDAEYLTENPFIGGAKVLFASYDDPGAPDIVVMTDENGMFMAEVPPGKFLMIVSKDDYYLSPKDLTITTVDFSIKVKMKKNYGDTEGGGVTGEVNDASTGEPLKDATTSLDIKDSQFDYSYKTNDKGAWGESWMDTGKLDFDVKTDGFHSVFRTDIPIEKGKNTHTTSYMVPSGGEGTASIAGGVNNLYSNEEVDGAAFKFAFVDADGNTIWESGTNGMTSASVPVADSGETPFVAMVADGYQDLNQPSAEYEFANPVFMEEGKTFQYSQFMVPDGDGTKGGIYGSVIDIGISTTIKDPAGNEISTAESDRAGTYTIPNSLSKPAAIGGAAEDVPIIFTPGNGFFYIPDLEPGTSLIIRAPVDGYYTSLIPVTVERAGAMTFCGAVLQPLGGAGTGAVNGVVIDHEAGLPVPNATVTLLPGDQTAVTDDNGWYGITDVAPGMGYIVQVAADGLGQMTSPEFLIQDGVSSRIDPISYLPTAVSKEPSAFAVSDPFPNPFNPSTTIKINLPADNHVQFAVYDILGRRVRLLEDRMLPAGEHAIVWNARDDAGNPAASGVYFFRCNAGNSVRTGKMTFIR
jgi:hypothetical protein